MKRYLFVVGLFLISSILAKGQNNDEQAIRQLLSELSTAMKKADVSTLDHMYSNDYIFISPTGVKFSKAERLQNVKATPPPEVFSYENPQIRIYDNAAVVNMEVKIKPKGQELQDNWATLVLTKKDGHWQVVNGQGTRKSVKPS